MGGGEDQRNETLYVSHWKLSMYVLIVSNSRIRLYFLPNVILLLLYYRIPKFSWKELVLRDFSVLLWQLYSTHHKATEIRNWTVSRKISIVLRVKLLSNFGNKHEQSWVLSTLNYLFHMKPNRCTLLLSMFISTSLHVSGNYVPIIRRTCCICATLVFFICGRKGSWGCLRTWCWGE